MRSILFKILIGLLIIYVLYLAGQSIFKSGTGKAEDQSGRRSRLTARNVRTESAEFRSLQLNSPTDQSLLTLSGRNLFAYYQKPVIRTHTPPPVVEPVRPPVTAPPKETPPPVDTKPDISTPDPRLANYVFVAFFSTPAGDMVVLKEGEEEYTGSVGGTIRDDIEIISVRNIGTGQDYIEINVAGSVRPSKKVYFNPISF